MAVKGWREDSPSYSSSGTGACNEGQTPYSAAQQEGQFKGKRTVGAPAPSVITDRNLGSSCKKTKRDISPLEQYSESATEGE